MSEQFTKKDLTKKSQNIADWYNEVIIRAGLADYSPTKGCMVIKPYGYAIWEKIQATLDGWFKAAGVQNAYFPILIPMSLLTKEKEHVKGFSPELAVVTHGGGEELAEPYAIRPTSETIMYQTFADWIKSYRDLPLLLNQWCNVVRWEKRTYPFLRTTEFLWQEGHTVHRTEQEAIVMVLKALNWYKKIYEEYFAVSPYVGLKSDSERFAGAKTTYGVELVMPSGKALQAGTSHNLSDNFSKVFDINFLDESGQQQHPYQTSWGLSTRSIGGLVLAHGDDAGLILPPQLAPYQVVILTVNDDKKLIEYAQKLKQELTQNNVRVIIDTDANHSLGYRINEWELKGVPLRLEIGKKEMANNEISFARRDTLTKGKMKQNELVVKVNELLDDIQQTLFKRSAETKHRLTANVETYDQFKHILADGKMFIRAPWCENADCEQQIKEETKATTRVLEMELIAKSEKLKCVKCGQPAKHRWLFAQSY